MDPNHKLEYFKNTGWEDEWIEVATKIAHDEFDRSYAHMIVETSNETEEPDSSMNTRTTATESFAKVSTYASVLP